MLPHARLTLEIEAGLLNKLANSNLTNDAKLESTLLLMERTERLVFQREYAEATSSDIESTLLSVLNAEVQQELLSMD
jgi:hypothetical protein